MNPLRPSDKAPIVRTDFSSEAAWGELCAAVRTPQPQYGFLPNVDLISDRAYEGVSTERIIDLATTGSDRTFVLIADRETFQHPERPILVVDLFDETHATFRVVPESVWSVENNLSIGNLDFDDFVRECGADGIFRGI